MTNCMTHDWLLDNSIMHWCVCKYPWHISIDQTNARARIAFTLAFLFRHWNTCTVALIDRHLRFNRCVHEFTWVSFFLLQKCMLPGAFTASTIMAKWQRKLSLLQVCRQLCGFPRTKADCNEVQVSPVRAQKPKHSQSHSPPVFPACFYFVLQRVWVQVPNKQLGSVQDAFASLPQSYSSRFLFQSPFCCG